MLNAQDVSLVKVTDFGNNPGNLELFVHIPAGNSGSLMPLMVALHGCNQSAQGMADQSGWNELSEKYGFAVLYPQQKFINNPSRCFNWFYSKGKEPSGEEVSIREMIRFVVDHYPIDTTHIYCYGLSAGAVMSVNLMARYPCLIHAGASLAGGAYHTATNMPDAVRMMLYAPDKSPEELGALMPPCDSMCLPLLIVLQGSADPVVNPENAQALIGQWTNWWNTDDQADRMDSAFAGNKRVVRKVFLSGDGLDCVIYYDIRGLGHALPIDPGSEPTQGGSSGVFTRDIGFFSTMYIAKDLGLIRD